MKPDHPVTFKPETAADAWLGLLAARGVEYLFANGGTDFAPVVEAYAKGQSLGWRLPEIVIVPHENMGVAMAHGYAMVTGRPQAMMVHVGVGTANALNGLINASRQNVPILFTAGRTPITESGALTAARNNYIHWAQEHFDQGGMLREFMKWDYELRHAEQVETVIDRALAIAKSEPQGPVYVTLPREILASDFSNQKFSDQLDDRSRLPSGRRSRGARGGGEAARRRAACRCSSPRTAAARSKRSRAIEQLARRWRSRRSTTGRATSRSRPSTRCIAAGIRTRCSRKPTWCWWSTATCRGSRRKASPRPEAKVVHIGPDPLFARYPLRGFRTDLALTGAVGADAAGAAGAEAQKQAVSLEADRGATQGRDASSAEIREESARRSRPDAGGHHRQVALGLHQQGARRRHAPGQRVPDRARGDDDPRAGPLLRQPVGRRPGLGHGRGARREARLAGQDRDLRARRRRLHVRQPDRRALRVGGDAACRCCSSSPTTRAGRRCTARRCRPTRRAMHRE